MKICSPMKWLNLTLRIRLFCNFFFSYVIAYQIIVIAQLWFLQMITFILRGKKHGYTF